MSFNRQSFQLPSFCLQSFCVSVVSGYGVGLNMGVHVLVMAGNTKGGSITVPLTSCLTGLESAVL